MTVHGTREPGGESLDSPRVASYTSRYTSDRQVSPGLPAQHPIDVLTTHNNLMSTR